MSAAPPVSVIVPTYNHGAYIADALDSIFAQQYAPVQVIVVNDGSRDDTAERLRAYGTRITVLEQENCGIFESLNRGILAATGEWLAFLDSDDLWTGHRLEKQLAAVSGPSHAVFGMVQNFYSPETTPEFRAAVGCPPDPVPGIWQTTLLLRRADFLRVGLFRPEWKVGNFIEWFERFQAQNMSYTVLPEVLTLRRLHPGNTGIRERSAQADYARILKVVLDRRRGKPAGA